jgi:glycogen debranching enzyme
MAKDEISILDGSTFVVSDSNGDLEAGPDQVQGLFYRDTHFLSRWILTVNGRRPDVLSIEHGKYFEAQFFLYPPTGTIYENPYLSIIRKRKVGEGFHEDITVLNHRSEALQVEIQLEAGADFADLFEVKDALEKKGETYREVRQGELVLGYRREDFVRETRIWASEAHEVSENGFLFRLDIPAQSEWNTCIASGRCSERKSPWSSTATTSTKHAPTWRSCSTSGWRKRPSSYPTRMRWSTSTVRVSSTSPHSGSTRSSSRASRSPPPACRGS